MGFTEERFPQIHEAISDLVRQHAEIEDEELLLAIAYDPGRESGDIFLFEVIEGFGANLVGTDRELFEITYGPSPEFPMREGQRIHLVMTSPPECKEALRARWENMEEVRRAVQRGDFEVLFADKEGNGSALLREIRNE